MENIDSTTTTDQMSVNKNTGNDKSMAQEVDLKEQMEKATEWAKKNPIPAGKFIFICCNNNSAQPSKAYLRHRLIRARRVN